MSDPPSQPSPIAHVSTLAPATAVAFLGDSHVLSGHARFVNIVPLASSSSVKQKRIFTRERIHGIRVSPELGKVVFWGGRRIRVCGSNWLLGAADGDASPEEAPLAPDWVLTVKLLEDGRVLAVGAHNALLVFEPRTETWSQIGCGERTMLYSADLRIELDDGGLVTVVGGTVFGEILVWQWRPELAVGKVWKRLRGHDGSVFSVQLHGTMVASCSDDRTVRLWDLPLVPDELDTAVNTGMGGDEASSDNRNRGNGCIAVGWGHQARPWKIVCLPPKNGEEITLATVSEDLTARFWRIRNDGDKKSLEYFKTFTMHSGKNVWSVDVDPERKLMVTGGNDGRVCLLDYSEEGEDGMTFSLNTVLQSLPDDAMDKEVSTSNKVMKSQRPDNWRNYSFVNARRFVATTEHGRVLLHDLSSSSWTLLGRWDGLRNWGHSAAWEGSGLVALGDSNGYLRIIDVDSKQSWAWEADGVRRKVDGVFVCQADDANDGGVFLFLRFGSFSSEHVSKSENPQMTTMLPPLPLPQTESFESSHPPFPKPWYSTPSPFLTLPRPRNPGNHSNARVSTFPSHSKNASLLPPPTTPHHSTSLSVHEPAIS